jgi:hypothetical protein
MVDVSVSLTSQGVFMAKIAGPAATYLQMVMPTGGAEPLVLTLCAVDASGHIIRRHAMWWDPKGGDLDRTCNYFKRFMMLELRAAAERT